MLRFFRTIRKKLIEEDNVRKYLLYAIGEILLVVIGILIALQVNNWNEERKNKQQTIQYLTSLKSDLIEDIRVLNEGFDYAFADSLLIDNQIRRIKESDVHPDTVKNIILNEFNSTVRNPRPFNRKTYNTLISSGDIGLLSNEIAQRLVLLMNEQDIRNGLIQGTLGIHLPVVTSFYQSYPVNGLPLSDIIFPEMYSDIDVLQLLKEFNILVSSKQLNSERHMQIRRLLEQPTLELIELIDQQIRN